jgi:hypothetical protein
MHIANELLTANELNAIAAVLMCLAFILGYKFLILLIELYYELEPKREVAVARRKKMGDNSPIN